MLPPELLDRILQFMGDDKCSIAQFCLASQHFNQVARPRLYRTFRQRSCWRSNHLRTLSLFVRTAIERPKLMRHIKCVSLSEMGNGGSEWSPLPDYMVPLCARRIEEIWSAWLHLAAGDGFRKRWHEQVRLGYPQAILSVLLCSLPSLEQLYFEEGFQPDVFLGILDAAAELRRMPGTAAPMLCELPFSTLHSIRAVSIESMSYWLVPEYLQRLFDLPALQAYEITRTNGAWPAAGLPFGSFDNVTRWARAPPPSDLARLSIQHSSLSTTCLHTIVNSCVGLREFHFSYSNVWMCKGNFTPLSLLRALLPHAGTLEVLHANFVDDWDLWGEHIDIRDQRFDATLRSMSQLRKLSVSFSALFGVVTPELRMYSEQARPQFKIPDIWLPSILPPALADLTIMDCDARVVPHLENLALARDSFPDLRSVCCTMVSERTGETLSPVCIPDVRVEYVFMNQAQRWERTDLQYRPDASLLFNDDAMLRCEQKE